MPLLALLAPVALAAQAPAPTPADVRFRAEEGRIAEAEAIARQGGAGYTVALADVLVMRGRLAEADSLYRVAIQGGLAEARRAQAGRAELAERRGDRSEALRLASELTAAYQRRGGSWPTDDRVAVGRAYVVVGAVQPSAFRSALALFDEVTAADTTNVEAPLRAADLLLEKYNAPDARESYEVVAKREPGYPRAVLGLARAMAFDGQPIALPAARAALDRNPVLVPALLLLARLHLETEAYDSAAAAVARTLAIDSTAVPAWATLGAIAWIAGDSAKFRTIERRVLSLNPRSADFYAELAEAAARQRRYDAAAEFAATGIRLDSLSARALGVLGTNELRLGRMTEGKGHLDRAFALDPYHLWHKNTLDLLDDLSGFTVTETARFRFVAPKEDADLLTAYLGPLLETAYDSLAARYAYRPPTPIRLELYRNHADFSVRTVGLAGMGALGVSFGTVLAMDAPAARGPGEFNFGSTAWHELAHTFTLGASGNRVPRWISEGLSVLEERRARAGWGADVTADFLIAYAAKKIQPVSRINEGLVRPAYPAQVGHSYYQASLIMEMIEAEKGIAGIRDMLHGFRDGQSLDVVLRRVLGATPDELDRRFDAWLRKRFAAALAAVTSDSTMAVPPGGRYMMTVGTGHRLLAAGDTTGAVNAFTQADLLFPGYGGGDGPAWPMALILRRQGKLAQAAAQAARVTRSSETALEPNLFEGTVRLELGDTAGAAIAYERAAWIAPADEATHTTLATLYGALGKHALAVRERRALLALRPADPLEARYQLARALQRAGDVIAARRETLRVLESAPGFEKAQALLLELRGGAR